MSHIGITLSVSNMFHSVLVFLFPQRLVIRTHPDPSAMILVNLIYLASSSVLLFHEIYRFSTSVTVNQCQIMWSIAGLRHQKLLLPHFVFLLAAINKKINVENTVTNGLLCCLWIIIKMDLEAKSFFTLAAAITGGILGGRIMNLDFINKPPQ